ncbi:hypothetical protein KW850_08235 [Bacillus sp. sid0103]|uniref:hypothetical protein n=1 Tax=Bacillus sp. sid0103 TaxID=2856337 RepID=UPI001C473CA5|nr:hypothetical protein [Bacillus sp. sid0103]MBV7505242.1 hypothetical protein [Bacillus sp. sid0103]
MSGTRNWDRWCQTPLITIVYGWVSGLEGWRQAPPLGLKVKIFKMTPRGLGVFL